MSVTAEVSATLLHKKLIAGLPFPRTHLSHGLSDGYAARGVAVQDGDADLEFGDLAVRVPCHEALPLLDDGATVAWAALDIDVQGIDHAALEADKTR